ncbi:MAG TPA: 4-(cytidine 5'-diphospho)-2-C-methyl-D-erythritol kinase [Chlorobaculum sp.]|uniref:4-diphosphocytidyl-2-C-methyl-D-erythritol kinase n=1 Tax=Chlorobaculum tepidum (strain ATCC 49652 / DSM 12025 / NBRC 103806 / TLS) TaxID=194439 RepID=ISPE_CHLTE|nr:4-(cytidine 5'-diphospho)-2-C-methyl-D-erythritol kinase [Chlorobaculum tepidum]Q8KCC7.1 RecName: Full=4-diphosphocytidyl-2-C-methyl-D-erythritol kinase; Short=CMK; AltName: Full=4-(cytidine-5'-diphospho)-2-C-methyl-D-erythritol kinase [Chlorobaculum tepidum TLS]AAM72722.1 4-diphosphocytidyl-2C-methyl-D-erythritol kinase [Chlorobaculum tepidum TLS]HBU22615.1 4-(cytidine 5'-diphospho)-2-C-methyl-D-erythritol kinase [Chlorobaculum sp.]
MKHFSVKACAKINLGLLITSRRADGYHTLETIFAPIDWFDTLEFTESDAISMECSNLDLLVDDSNLCIRAAKALQEHTGVKRGATIKLLKRVPFGAGLGGGSSDAAATLNALCKLWQIDVPSAELHKLAVKLGADVPYFLEMKGLAYAAGIGEELEDLNLALPWHVVTVFPEVQVPTAWAYKNFHRQFERPVPDLKTLVRRLCHERDISVFGVFENDFASVVFEHYPVVREVRDALAASGAQFVSLSGSGSAVYALYEGRADAVKAAEAMSARFRINMTPAGFRME